MALENELALYERQKAELMEHQGKWVLIGNDRVVGFFDTYPDAIDRGYAEFGLDPFLVRQIEGEERVRLITRLAVPAAT